MGPGGPQRGGVGQDGTTGSRSPGRVRSRELLTVVEVHRKSIVATLLPAQGGETVE